MANMFTNDSRQFKFDVLVTICRAANRGPVDEDEIMKRFAKAYGYVKPSEETTDED